MSTVLGTDVLSAFTLTVEIAFGAKYTSPEDDWMWTDVTADVRMEPGISTSLGRGDEASTSQPAKCKLSLNNTSGNYSLGGQSSKWPYVRRGTPIRVTVDPADDQGERTVFLGFADGFTPGWDSNGRIPLVQLSASGTLRRLLQGNAPLFSAYRRTMTDTASVLAYWPMEEARGATYAQPVRGGDPMSGPGAETVKWASSNDFVCSDSLPDIGGAALNAEVDAYTPTGENQVRFFIKIPDNGVPNATRLAYVYTTGTLMRWDILYATAGDGSDTGNLSIYIYNNDGSRNSQVENIGFDMNGNLRRLELQMTQSGSDVNWWLGVLDATPRLDGGGGGGYNGTVTGKTVRTVNRVSLAPEREGKGIIFGHLTVQNDVTSTFEAKQAFWAWQVSKEFPSGGEAPTAATSRLVRLCKENSLPLTRYTGAGTQYISNYESMGPQLVAPLLDLLRECEAADQGQIWDGRSAGLTVTTRRYREDGNIALAVSMDNLSEPFDVIDDDQRTRNKVEVQRTFGIRATYEDIDGPMGTDIIGTYDSSVSINSGTDFMTEQYAAFLVSLGTVEGYRYPSVTLDLRANPGLAGAVLDVVPGSRIMIDGPSVVLDSFPDTTIDLIVEGIEHQISNAGWRVTFKCSAFSPWGAGLATEDMGDTSDLELRADTDGSSLLSDAPLGSTTLSVTTPSGPLWSTNDDDYPLFLSVGGIRVLATGCSGITTTQVFTVNALPIARFTFMPVQLWDQRPLGL